MPPTYVLLSWPSSHQVTCSATQPEIVRLTLRFPLRAVVASSSAMRSSRSAQQFPPRSAAFALVAVKPPARRPAATKALRLYFFIDLLPICVGNRDGGRPWTQLARKLGRAL